MCRFINIALTLVALLSLVNGYERSFNSCHDFKLQNGRMRIKPKGRLAKFQCNRGFMLAGEKYSYCIKGAFDVPPPVCVKPTCTKIKQLNNGLILPSYNGGVVNFYCKPGFTMRGSNISYCDGTRWSHNLPACITTHTPTPTTCDFETEDLCGWSHDLNHDFDWRRLNYQTPSGHIGTGPQHDHTKGENQDGYYVYIEATSWLENDTARLISPLYSPYPKGVCFTFWYHMYGKDMGQLRVYIRRESEQKLLKPLWTQSGNQGNVWKWGKVEIAEGIDEGFQIILEGIRGKSYVSDMAVDDVELTESCPEEVQDIYSSSTIETSTDEDPDIYFGTCLNRCDDNNTEIIASDTVSCECNEMCHDRNTCCPDYTGVCLIAAFEEYSTDFTDVFNTTETMETETFETTTPKHETTENVLLTSKKVETMSPTEGTRTTMVATTSPTTITPNIPRNNTRYIKPIVLNISSDTVETTTPFSVNTVPSSTNAPKIIVTKSTPKPIPIPKIVVTKSTPKPIPTPKIIVTKSTPKPIPIPKINKNTNNIVKINVTINNTTFTKTTKKVYPKIKSTTTSTTLKPLPTEKTFSTDNLVTTKFPAIVIFDYTTEKQQTLKIETDYEPSKIPILEKPEPEVQMVTQNKKLETVNGDSNLTLIIFGTSTVIVIGAIVSVVLFVKYNTRCIRWRFRNSRNSDSMSDVRFLASDEVLDFTWRSSDM